MDSNPFALHEFIPRADLAGLCLTCNRHKLSAFHVRHRNTESMRTQQDQALQARRGIDPRRGDIG